MPPVVFEPKIPANERPQTHALERAATRIGANPYYGHKFINYNPEGRIQQVVCKFVTIGRQGVL